MPFAAVHSPRVTVAFQLPAVFQAKAPRGTEMMTTIIVGGGLSAVNIPSVPILPIELGKGGATGFNASGWQFARPPTIIAPPPSPVVRYIDPALSTVRISSPSADHNPAEMRLPSATTKKVSIGDPRARVPEMTLRKRRSFGDVLKKRIVDRGMPIDRLAIRARIPKGELQGYVTGRALPGDIKTVKRIAAGFSSSSGDKLLGAWSWDMVGRMPPLPGSLKGPRRVLIERLRWASWRWRGGNIRGWGLPRRDPSHFKEIPYDSTQEINRGGPAKADAARVAPGKEARDFRIRDAEIKRLLAGRLDEVEALYSADIERFYGRLLEMIVGERWNSDGWARARVAEIRRSAALIGGKRKPAAPSEPGAPKNIAEIRAATPETISGWMGGRTRVVIDGRLRWRTDTIGSWRTAKDRAFEGLPRDRFYVVIEHGADGGFTISDARGRYAARIARALSEGGAAVLSNELGDHLALSSRLPRPEGEYRPKNLSELGATISKERISLLMGDAGRIALSGSMHGTEEIDAWQVHAGTDGEGLPTEYFTVVIAGTESGDYVIEGASGTNALPVARTIDKSGAARFLPGIEEALQRRSRRKKPRPMNRPMTIDDLQSVTKEDVLRWFGDSDRITIIGRYDSSRHSEIRSWWIAKSRDEARNKNYFVIELAKREDGAVMTAAGGKNVVHLAAAFRESGAVQIPDELFETAMQRSTARGRLLGYPTSLSDVRALTAEELKGWTNERGQFVIVGNLYEDGAIVGWNILDRPGEDSYHKKTFQIMVSRLEDGSFRAADASGTNALKVLDALKGGRAVAVPKDVEERVRANTVRRAPKPGNPKHLDDLRMCDDDDLARWSKGRNTFNLAGFIFDEDGNISSFQAADVGKILPNNYFKVLVRKGDDGAFSAADASGYRAIIALRALKGSRALAVSDALLQTLEQRYGVTARKMGYPRSLTAVRALSKATVDMWAGEKTRFTITGHLRESDSINAWSVSEPWMATRNREKFRIVVAKSPSAYKIVKASGMHHKKIAAALRETGFFE